MIATFDMHTTRPDWALGHAWDVVLPGAAGTSDTARRGLRRFDGRRKGADQPAFCGA